MPSVSAAVAGRAATGGADPVVPDRDRRDALAGLAGLVCADPDWLRHEFAELIEANYPVAAAVRADPPRRTRVVTGAVRRPPCRPGPRRKPTGRPARMPGRRLAPDVEPGRQRSPPGTEDPESPVRRGPTPGDTGAVIVTRRIGRR